MMNCSTVLVQNTWGVHLNFEGYFSSPPSCPAWLTQLQQQDWQWQGMVVWDADLHIVAHLYAGYILELLEHLQGNNAWKTNGLVIGSPSFQLSTNSVSIPSTKEIQIFDPSRGMKKSSSLKRIDFPFFVLRSIQSIRKSAMPNCE